MSGFKKYMHIEKYGNSDVEKIEDGLCYIFPKIDGTNGSVWYEEGDLKFGSRNRELSLEKDNAGFCRWGLSQSSLLRFFQKYPILRLFGEWLVPHTVKGYLDDAWRRFYVFDVCHEIDGELVYIDYDSYKPLLDEFGIEYIEPVHIVKNPSYEDLMKSLERNRFLLKDEHPGEGVVVKNYGFTNKFGKTVWAKLVTEDFKNSTRSSRVEEKESLECRIVEASVTDALLKKEVAKLVNEYGDLTNKMTPALIERVFNSLIEDDLKTIVVKNNYPTVNFSRLRYYVEKKVKSRL